MCTKSPRGPKCILGRHLSLGHRVCPNRNQPTDDTFDFLRHTFRPRFSPIAPSLSLTFIFTPLAASHQAQEHFRFSSRRQHTFFAASFHFLSVTRAEESGPKTAGPTSGWKRAIALRVTPFRVSVCMSMGRSARESDEHERARSGFVLCGRMEATTRKSSRDSTPVLYWANRKNDISLTRMLPFLVDQKKSRRNNRNKIMGTVRHFWTSSPLHDLAIIRIHGFCSFAHSHCLAWKVVYGRRRKFPGPFFSTMRCQIIDKVHMRVSMFSQLVFFLLFSPHHRSYWACGFKMQLDFRLLMLLVGFSWQMRL